MSGKISDKLVRDSFTIPKREYAVLAQLKARAVSLAHPAKKSEMLRAGLKLLQGLPDGGLLAALRAVPALKTGRPKGKVAGEPGQKPAIEPGRKALKAVTPGRVAKTAKPAKATKVASVAKSAKTARAAKVAGAARAAKPTKG
jgi:hypothetical protein